MEFILASKSDFEEIKAFYNHVIDCTEGMEKYARWKKGIHPTDSGICEYIENNAMYLLTENGEIAGAIAITMAQTQDYRPVSWKINAKDDEVSVIHILAVSPEFQRKGIGKRLIDEAVSLSKKQGKLSCRLDALSSNTPAQKMYEAKGFEYRGKQRWYAENTGWADFYLYEYVL